MCAISGIGITLSFHSVCFNPGQLEFSQKQLLQVITCDVVGELGAHWCRQCRLWELEDITGFDPGGQQEFFLLFRSGLASIHLGFERHPQQNCENLHCVNNSLKLLGTIRPNRGQLHQYFSDILLLKVGSGRHTIHAKNRHHALPHQENIGALDLSSKQSIHRQRSKEAYKLLNSSIVVAVLDPELLMMGFSFKHSMMMTVFLNVQPISFSFTLAKLWPCCDLEVQHHRLLISNSRRSTRVSPMGIPANTRRAQILLSFFPGKSWCLCPTTHDRNCMSAAKANLGKFPSRKCCDPTHRFHACHYRWVENKKLFETWWNLAISWSFPRLSNETNQYNHSLWFCRLALESQRRSQK